MATLGEFRDNDKIGYCHLATLGEFVAKLISWIELNIITAIIDDVNYIKLALFCMIPNKTIDTQANITLFTLSSNPGRGKIRESESLTHYRPVVPYGTIK